jgi:hypothetical protein
LQEVDSTCVDAIVAVVAAAVGDASAVAVALSAAKMEPASDRLLMDKLFQEASEPMEASEAIDAMSLGKLKCGSDIETGTEDALVTPPSI